MYGILGMFTAWVKDVKHNAVPLAGIQTRGTEGNLKNRIRAEDKDWEEQEQTLRKDPAIIIGSEAEGNLFGEFALGTNK